MINSNLLFDTLYIRPLVNDPILKNSQENKYPLEKDQQSGWDCDPSILPKIVKPHVTTNISISLPEDSHLCFVEQLLHQSTLKLNFISVFYL